MKIAIEIELPDDDPIAGIDGIDLRGEALSQLVSDILWQPDRFSPSIVEDARQLRENWREDARCAKAERQMRKQIAGRPPLDPHPPT